MIPVGYHFFFFSPQKSTHLFPSGPVDCSLHCFPQIDVYPQKVVCFAYSPASRCSSSVEVSNSPQSRVFLPGESTVLYPQKITNLLYPAELSLSLEVVYPQRSCFPSKFYSSSAESVFIPSGVVLPCFAHLSSPQQSYSSP